MGRIRGVLFAIFDRLLVLTQSENRQARQERQGAIFVDSRGVRAASRISRSAYAKAIISSLFSWRSWRSWRFLFSV